MLVVLIVFILESFHGCRMFPSVIDAKRRFETVLQTTTENGWIIPKRY